MKPRTAATVRLSGEDPQLVRLTDEITERLESGQPFDIETFVAEQPEYASELRRLYPALRALVGLGHEDDLFSALSSAEEPSADRTLGDFRILGEIGRGGMGVVYEAEQISLRRRVALKVLPFAAVLDPQQLQRFKNEARAAATLDHPGIVAVYSVGTDRGVHYYAMQLIEGQTLAEAIDELRKMAAPEVQPRELRKVGPQASDLAAGRFAPPDGRLPGTAAHPSHQPAEPRGDQPGEGARSAETHALQAEVSTHPATRRATRQAAFHRTAAHLGNQAAMALDHAHERGILHRDIKPGNLMLDSGGKIWITDFGLARIEADAGMTMTGDLLGTLRYMSPEQASAKKTVIDQRADIYSLGATLYELLTLHPAFEGADREAILRQIAFEEPPAPRRIDPSIPVDLEVIVGKAMRKDAEDRYETARELADDLARFLNDEPIRARRPTLAQRATKWTRRHRGMFWSAAAVMLVGMVGLVVSTVLIAQQREIARKETLLAETHFRAARDAVDRMLTKAANDLVDVPHAQNVRRALLEDALEFYLKFLGQKASDPEIRYETGLAYMRVGIIHMAMGHREEAATACRHAIGLLKKLARDLPSEPKVRLGLADSYSVLSETTFWTEHIEEYLRSRRQRLLILQQLAIDFPAEPFYRALAAYAQTHLGNGLIVAGRNKEAMPYLRTGVSAWETLYEDFPEMPRDLNGLSSSHHWLGSALVDVAHAAEAEQELRLALNYQEQYLRQDPTSPYRRGRIAHVVAWVGTLRRQQGRFEEAEQQTRRAIEIRQKLLDEFPFRTENRRRVAHLYFDLCTTLASRGFDEKAIQALRTSIFHQEKLLEADPGVSSFQVDLARRHYELGERLVALEGQSAAGVKEYRRSRKVWEQCVKEHPDDYESKKEFADFLVKCPAPQFREGLRAVRLVKETLQHAPQDMDAWVVLGAAHYRAGQWGEAIAALEHANQSTQDGDVRGWFLLAMSHQLLGHAQDARAWYDQALKKLDRKRNQSNDSRWQEYQRLRAETAALLEVDERQEGA